jgi:hypothetical protein
MEIPALTKQVFFNATLKYNETHQLYRPIPETDYVGGPTPEMDAAWEDLIGGEFKFTLRLFCVMS